MEVLKGKNVPVKIWTDEIDEATKQQLHNLASLPIIHHHVAAMPDVHFGLGATVGSVIATKGAIIPAAVGVDIGCGMCAVKLPFKIDRIEEIKKLRHSIERSIPVGRNENKKVSKRVENSMPGKPHSWSAKEESKAYKQLGSLGGGNHFVEVCQDENYNAWVMLHSGSRGIGNLMARKHIETAKGLMKKQGESLADPDLAYFLQNTKEFKAYVSDLLWAQAYAKSNRNEMMLRLLKDISFHVFGEDKGEQFMTGLRIDCHHNYTQQEEHFGKRVWLTRKGAVSAKKGELGIIPGSMGAKSFIVEGLGNPESFHSCAHGAGRKMSRNEAKKLFTEKDLKEQTKGVECRKDRGVVDEIPGAYKDIDSVMKNQQDLVKPLHTLKQILCVKG